MAEHKMQLEDWLDDLCVRFIIHLPKEDLSSVARICFQVEEAQWFYEDFIRPLDPSLPSMSLRSFCLRIFQHCPLLAPFSAENHMRAFDEFMQYKTRVPVRGAILLNEAMDSTVLVKGWKKGANWSFPRGKINKDEDDLDCAVREVYEETGFDIKQAGLVPKDDEVKYIQISMREQQIRLYVFRNIPMDTVFEPKTRKEISKVEWYKLSELPAFRKKGNNSHDDGPAAAASNANKFYMVAPFLVPLKKWVVQQRKRDEARSSAAAATSSHLPVQPPPIEELMTEDDLGAHTEHAPAPPLNGTPAIETLEGATRELQRLLKVQPPTEGLQMSPSASSTGKGEALLALLRPGAGAAAPPQHAPAQHAPQHQGPPHHQQAYHPNAQVAHTPMDLNYASAPEPHAPHHHHHAAQRMPVPNYQSPANFPVPASSFQNPQPGYYSSQPQAAAQGPPHPTQFYGGRNPFVNPAQQPRSEPVLLHPQPLPPQVQQSVLTRGILPTPGLPEAARQGGLHAQHAGPGGFHGQQGGPNPLAAARGHESYASPPPAGGKPAQLTGHAMSLLNAFKTGPQATPANKPRENIPQNNNAQSSTQPQYRSAHWGAGNTAPTTQAPNPAAQYLPHHMTPAAQPMGTPSGPKPPQPAESHRIALLDMFKKAGPRSPLSNEIRMQPAVQPAKAPHSPGFTRKEEPTSPSRTMPSAAEAIASAAEANGAPVRMNPDVNLPYRAVRILSRPKQAEPIKPELSPSAQAQMQRLHHRLSPLGSSRHHEIRNTARQTGGGLQSPRERTAFTPHHHPMEQDLAKRSPQVSYAAAQAASLPYAQQQQQSPNNVHAVPAAGQPGPVSVLQRRKDSNPEQKQKLLSLFSKENQQQQQQQSVGGFSAEDKGKRKEAAGVFDQPPPPPASAPRSRVASFTSEVTAGGGAGGGPGSPTSRRGSQTPISPADRSFLFSYLESVTNKGR
ncbi:hypothetical protein C8A05DRAFT_37635 [Staphylotrichum tortipilum]|uniref:Nudix hydrolase domain-containing protein n=1 Tax=Staphylotrichum tortipilum TaxID=2831512 RepID=A0AAN6MDA1_9PEZI|nr:hypothetical protein C8A05DRAFT_37635 [Staphylotrichum longicolle]